MTFDRVRLDRRAIGRFLREDASLQAALRREAAPVAARIRGTAPVDTGKFQQSIHVVMDTTDRAVARVVSTDPKALIVEADTGVMARALDGAAE